MPASDPRYLEKKMTLKLVAALAVSLATLALQSRADVIKVGVIAPMSGPFSVVGQTWEGATKAYQKLNGTTAGGHTIEVIYRDLPDINPAQAKALAQELIIKEGAQYIAGLYFTPIRWLSPHSRRRRRCPS